MFDADRPILKHEQDRLGRSGFAKYLARSILDHNNTESLVIGLYGAWGTGKTSIINLTLEELNLASSNMLDEERPIILNFSPWSYSGQDQLIYSFFRRLTSEIRRAEYVEDADKIIQLLELYVSFFTHLPVPRIFRQKHNFVTKLAKPRVTKEEAYGWESGRDLTQVKAELNTLLRKQKHKIIIFIDNISRIEDNEIKQIFQIVKSMGDYTNTVYVLAMDKPHVIRAMDNVYGSGGIHYLEKVVQLPFEIPDISKQDVESILLDRLQQVVSIVPEGMWDNNYWADIYYSTLKYFFKNCRDITRYVNALSFSYPRVKDLVNPVDFFAITALSTFSPNVYDGIRDNKDLFTDFVSNVFEPTAEELKEYTIRCDEILNRSDALSRQILQQLLSRLFPTLRNFYPTEILFHHSEEMARRNKRVCSADFFDTYFLSAIPVGVMSTAEINTLISLTTDESAFAQAILRLNKDERILPFLALLDSTEVYNIPIQYIPHAVSALLDCADLFPEGVNTALNFDTSMRVHRILHQLLRRLPTTKARFEVFRDAINKSTLSLYSMVYELNMHTTDDSIPLEQLDFTQNELETLQKLTVEKIKYWATIGRLAEHPKLIAILYAWKEWGDAIECRQFVGLMVLEDKGLIAFLCDALKDPIDQTITKLAKSPDWVDSLHRIEDFISVNILAPHAKMLFEDPDFEKLREREQLAILIFLDLIHAETIKVIPNTSA
ncbi:MAG: P-loop NTPase fold protein [Gammaproteobacteria bacterium]